jgi:hypothetical protein
VPPGRGILVVHDGRAPAVAEIVSRLRTAFPRLNVFELTGPEGAGLGPGAIAVPSPAASARLIARFLRRLKIQAVIVAGAPDAHTSLFVDATKLGIPLAVIGPPLGGVRGVLARVSLCAVSSAEHDQGAAAGIAPGALLIGAGVDAIIARLTPLLVSERPPGKLANILEDRLVALLARPPLANVMARKFETIATIDALADRLGRPQSILCLGNGPSSEDAELLGIRPDALFRVNHSWLGRPHHTRPDVIFTGKRDTLDAYRDSVIFGFQTEHAARRIMLRSILIPRRFTCFTAERLRVIDFDRFAPYKPTNGAVMIATAAALQPKRIIVAGVDLFSDPRGSYPGDSATPNAYTLAHDRELEARFILETLCAFSGDVVVIGDVLRERWQRHRLEARDAS